METITNNRALIKPWKLLLALILVNTAGFCLRYYNLNTYITIVGFRCHLSLIFPFLLIFDRQSISYIKKSFLNPEYKKVISPILLITLPFLIVAGTLFLLQKLDLGDPEYFYEFGVSTIIDYPVYLLWNFPQMMLLFFFLVYVSNVSGLRFLVVSCVIFLLFSFELFPLNKALFSFTDAGILLACSIIFSLLINYFRNVYWFCISAFTLLWIAFLAFGSNSKGIINLLFASRYNYWEGFFEVSKEVAPYTIMIYFGIALMTAVVGFSFRKKVTD